MALRVGIPPSAIAGKNLSEVTPRSSAASISVGVATPGSTGTCRPVGALSGKVRDVTCVTDVTGVTNVTGVADVAW